MRALIPIATTCFGLLSATVVAQQSFAPDVIVPATTIVNKGEKPATIHTQNLIYTGEWNRGSASGPGGLFRVPNFGPSIAVTPSGYSPAEISGQYGIPQYLGGGAIAVVEAFDYPTALNDFNVFSRQYALPQETSTVATGSKNKSFEVVYATGAKPTYDPNWALEGSLDIEWTHAMAAGAKIYLVECASDSIDDIMTGVKVAGSLPGVKEVCMSFGALDFPGETSYDSTFTAKNVVYFSGAGDYPAYGFYPATSPNVVGVGGTSLNNGYETGWAYGGGGPGANEALPAFQSPIAAPFEEPTQSVRLAPDMAAVADPSTGLSVYDSAPDPWRATGWLVMGGTSAACAVVTGITNSRGYYANSSQQELTRQYGTYTDGNYASAFNDITTGTNGTYSCGVGYDLITGLGSPLDLYGPAYETQQTPSSAQPYPGSTLVSGNLASLQDVDEDFYTIESGATSGGSQVAGVKVIITPTYPYPLLGATTTSFFMLITTFEDEFLPLDVQVYNNVTKRYDTLASLDLMPGWQSSFVDPVNAAPYVNSSNQVIVVLTSTVPPVAGESNPLFFLGFDQVALYSNSGPAPGG